MTHYELILYWLALWFEVVLCILVFARKMQKRLPFFTAYVALLMVGTLGIQLVYHRFGFRSPVSYSVAWFETGMNLLARFFVIGELCRYELRAYRGIWALTWRGLALITVFFLLNATIDAWGQAGGIAIYGLTIERDVAITSVVVLLALLLIRNYYGLALEPMLMWIALGMCLVSTIDILNDAVLYRIFTGRLLFWFFGRYAASWSGLSTQVDSANDLWNSIRTFGFITSMSIWGYALRKPLPAPANEPVLFPGEVYRELSPAVNLRLRAFNERLLELLKP